MFDLIKHLVKNDIEHTVSGNGNITVVTCNLDMEYVDGVDALPDNLTVGGWLDLRGTAITALPDNLTVGGSLDLRHTAITALPDNLTVGGWLDLRGTAITALPDNLTVGGLLDLRHTAITALPDNFTVGGSLYLDAENFSNIAYRKNCGFSYRTIFAVWTGKEFRIAAGCFFGTIDEFEKAVDDSYDGADAEAYKQAGRDCVAELAEKLNRRE